MKVILKEKINTLGQVGDIVTVKPGYARNYLLPNNMAIAAKSANVKELEHHKRALMKKLAKIKADQEVFKNKLESLTITIRRKAGEEDKLFGSVTNQDITDNLIEKGYTIDKRSIELAAPIKKLGVHKVPLRLMEGVIAELNVAVVAEV